MNKYTVEVTSVTTVEVEAESQDRAIEEACGRAWEFDADSVDAKVISELRSLSPKVQKRYSRVPLAEPIIWEPEDWTPEEWETLCKVSGDLPPDRTQRIVFHLSEMESYVIPKPGPKDYPDRDRTYEVTEACPHCGAEITMTWDTDAQGFEVFCPSCGKRLMLCDECLHDESHNGSCNYSSETGTCFRRCKSVAAAGKE